MRGGLARVVALCAGALLAPAGAQAATLSTAPCVGYRGDQDISVRGSGFTPGARVAIAFGRHDLQAIEEDAGRLPFMPLVTADSAGNVTGKVRSGPAGGAWRYRTLELNAYDPEFGTPLASAPVRFIRRSVTLPRRAGPSAVVTWRVYGFPPGRPLYLHIGIRRISSQLVGRGWRNLSSQPLGTPTGPCGLLTVRRRVLSAQARAEIRRVTARSRFAFFEFGFVFTNQPRVRRSEVFGAVNTFDADSGGLYFADYWYERRGGGQYREPLLD